MTKIKNFRITMRPRDIARWLKNQRQLQTTPELEAAIEHAIQDAKRWIQPAAVYTTLTRATAEKMTPIALPEGAVALSVVAASIGPGLEAERQAAEVRSDTLREALLAGLQSEALGQAVQFVARLIQEQAKDEECSMTAPEPTALGASAVLTLGALVGVQRIGLEPDPAAGLPAHARVAWFFWTPLVKNAPRRAAEKAVA